MAETGADQTPLNERAIAAGRHNRASLEDNVHLDLHTSAFSDATLIRRTADVSEKLERAQASSAQAH